MWLEKDSLAEAMVHILRLSANEAVPNLRPDVGNGPDGA